MVEAEIVNDKSLEMAKKAVSLKDSYLYLDTLTCVYAQLGKSRFKKAIEIETKAIKKASNEGEKDEFKKKISKW